MVLLVEDDSLIRASTAMLVEHLGHTVVRAANGQSALVAMQTQQFDVLLVDIGLGDMSGEAVADQARKLQPSIGIVYASGQGAKIAQQDATMLKKPFDRAALAAALEAFKKP
jgi:CheY-like chemotaxis protein